MFSDEERYVDFDYEGWYDAITFAFIPTDAQYSLEYAGSIIPFKNFNDYEIDEDLKNHNKESVKKIYETLSNTKPAFLLIKRKNQKNIHYAV